MKRSRQPRVQLRGWGKGFSVPGLDALEFLERSRDIVEEHVIAAPRLTDTCTPERRTGTR